MLWKLLTILEIDILSAFCQKNKQLSQNLEIIALQDITSL
jgi:hypothetical protein